MTPEQLAIKDVGKLDLKRHLEEKVDVLMTNSTMGGAVYTNARSGSYDRDKLHGFENPPGERLIVKFDTSGSQGLENEAGRGITG